MLMAVAAGLVADSGSPIEDAFLDVTVQRNADHLEGSLRSCCT
jgi:hypothetical protein